MNVILEKLNEVLQMLDDLSLDDKVQIINEIKLKIREHSPFKNEPVDCVIWVKQENVHANDYNPNSVAPPEMRLLETSIEQDGYTQPIVSWKKEQDYFEVVDGFHRNRVGKESPQIRNRIHNYLPLTVINDDRKKLQDRMASTIRHNRARGKHSVDSMTNIVVELKKRNWSDAKISKNLGMDLEEINRLSQISGLTEAFRDFDFSASWHTNIFDSDLDDSQLAELLDE